MTKPVFILTQGAWHVSDVWQKLTPVLEAKGHKVRTLEWPSVIQEPAVKSYDEDIATIRKVVEEEVDAGNDVVVVGHSWSAQPINSGVAEFSKTERAKQGKRGGITKLAFLCAFVVPEGTALIDALGGEPDKVGIWDIQGDIVYVKNPAYHFYADLPEEDQKYWVSKLKPHALATKLAKSSGEAYRTIPSVYLICEEDNGIPPEAQEGMVKAAQDAGADLKAERLKSSHSPFLSRPEETADFLLRAAS